MSDIVNVHNIAAYLDPLPSIAPNTTTAPTATQQLGRTVNRLTATGGASYRSAAHVLTIKAVLAAKKKVTIARAVQTGSDTASFAAYGDAITSTVIGSTSATAAQTINQCISDAIDLGNAKQYIRFNVTPTPSATSTDTIAIAGTWVLGGADKNS